MLRFEDIVQTAREVTGLPDPDKDTWKEGLQTLLRDHAKADLLTDRGRDIIKRRYVNALATRMRVDEYIRQHPEVLDTPVERPVFILGMPRTGTTMTSHLMGADPANRSVLRWEAYNVAPPAAPGALYSDERCEAERLVDEQILKSNPEGAAAHFEPADGPTECVHLVAQDFRSMMYTALTTTPVYADWVLNCDMSSAFEHRRRVLQVLQSTNPGRWVLKMPSDAVFIHWIFREFPDAKVIWTHRDPFAALASSFSMRGNSRKLFNKDVDQAYMACKYPVQLATHLWRPMEVARERPDDVFHLYYDDMLVDPLAEMKKVYAWLGDEWTAETEAGMTQWIADNPKGRLGKHSYSLAKSGFTKQELEPYFSEYLKLHPVATGQQAG